MEGSHETFNFGKGSMDKDKMNVKQDEAIVWGLEGRSLEFTIYDFSQVLEATDNFSEENKLGQGGFGPVYKVTVEQYHYECT
jgi:hypothetical protein